MIAADDLHISCRFARAPASRLRIRVRSRFRLAGRMGPSFVARSLDDDDGRRAHEAAASVTTRAVDAG